MTPEDILLEAIAAASLHGDSPALRELMCRRLQVAMARLGLSLATDKPGSTSVTVKSRHAAA